MSTARKQKGAKTVETRRVFPPEYKREAVRLTLVGDRSVRAVALDLGVNPNLLSQWKRQALARAADGCVHGVRDDAEPRRRDSAAPARERHVT